MNTYCDIGIYNDASIHMLLSQVIKLTNPLFTTAPTNPPWYKYMNEFLVSVIHIKHSECKITLAALYNLQILVTVDLVFIMQ